MGEDTLKGQRTYALVGHGGCGKTSVAEMMLHASGAISRQGKIEEGTTTLDYEPEEIKRRGSVQPGFARYEWKKNQHFLIDAPGDTNFIGDVAWLLQAADSVLFVIDAVDGVKPLSRRLWGEIKKLELPAVVAINKMDRDLADYDKAFDGVRDVLGVKPFPLYLPLGGKQDFRGVVDVLRNKAFFFEAGGLKEGDVPDDSRERVESIREKMVEEIAVCDESLMEKYLAEGSLTYEEMVAALREAVLCGELTPVIPCAALESKGGGLLLDAVQELFASPLQHRPWEGKKPSGEEDERESSLDEPVACQVFKTLIDPFAGQLTVLRVLSGQISPDVTLANPAREGKERLGQLLFLLGKNQIQCKETVGPGAIVAVAKLKDVKTGDTLCDEKTPFLLDKPALPGALITYKVRPAEKGEEDKVFQALTRLHDEDVTLKLVRDEETGDTLLSGMGQLHIETAIEKARRRFKTNIVLEAPTIPYRETFKGKVEVQGRHKKQTGGRGQFGDCWVRFEPKARGEGYEFVDAVVGGVVPRQYIPAVDKGVQESAQRGFLAGFPMVDFKATLYDGSYHTVDSSEMAFKIAGSLAFKKAMESVKVALLEPVMLATVSVPDQYMGDVIGYISSRRGKIQGSDSAGGFTEVKALVPMAEMMDFAQDLGSMTGGMGSFAMEFDHYEEAPPPVTEKVVAEHKRKEE